MTGGIIALALLLAPSGAMMAGAGTGAGGGGGSPCTQALDRYTKAGDSISNAIHVYADCVGGSHGKDDCALEFGQLRNAQDEFATSISDMREYCRE